MHLLGLTWHDIWFPERQPQLESDIPTDLNLAECNTRMSLQAAHNTQQEFISCLTAL
jgi:hypothetical protein